MILNSPYISGSSTITGNLTVLGSISGSINSAISASYATTASYADTFTVAGTLTAQKLVVQTITSSIVYSSGSNIFGSSSTDTQTFTGSVNITGSLSTTGSSTFSGTVTAANINVTSNAIPANGMYLSVANTLNFATNSGNRMTIGTTGAITMTSALTLGNFLTLTTANTFIYGGTTVGSIQYGNSTSSTHLKTYGATHATLANVIQLTNNSVVSLTLAASGAATFASSIAATSATFSGEMISTYSGSAAVFRNHSGGTVAQYIDFINTGGRFLLGNNNSTGGSLGTGTSAYSTVLMAVGATALELGTNSTNRLTITSGGDVYIGDTTSINSTRLHVKSTVNRVTVLTTTQTVGAAIEYYANTSTLIGYLGNGSFLTSGAATTDFILRSENALAFNTNGSSERMRITSGGDVIVKGSLADFTIGSSGAELFFGRNSANYITANGGGGAEIRIISNTNGVVLANGGTSWGSLSDENSKDIIEPIINACDNLSQVRTIIGKYKTDDKDKRRLFLIAQDIEKVYPEAVFRIKNEEEEESLALNYQDLIPVLVKAIQELKAEIDLLKGIAPIQTEDLTDTQLENNITQ